MARKRMLDPNIWDSASFASLSVLAKLIFIGLISNADDEGRGRANANYLKSKMFPYDTEMLLIDMEKSLDEIASKISVIFYMYRSNEYYSLKHWKKWQRVDKPQPSLIAPYSESNCQLIRGSYDEISKENTDGFHCKKKEEKLNAEIKSLNDVCSSIIVHLNQVAKTNFRLYTKQTISLIEARLNEQYTEEDLMAVIDKKAREWVDTDMHKYLRPETLFGEKFEGYFNQSERKHNNKKHILEMTHKYDMKKVEQTLFES